MNWHVVKLLVLKLRGGKNRESDFHVFKYLLQQQQALIDALVFNPAMMYDNYDDEMVAVLQLHLIKVGVYWLSLYNLLIKMTCCDFTSRFNEILSK